MECRLPLWIVNDWNVDFGLEVQQEKSRLTKESKDLALLISKIQLRQDEMPFEDNLIMKDEDIIEVNFYMLELVDMALGQRIKLLSVDLNAESPWTLQMLMRNLHLL